MIDSTNAVTQRGNNQTKRNMAMTDKEKLRILAEALDAMWKFATNLVEKHGMDGDDTLSDEEHQHWQEAAGAANAALSIWTGDSA